MALVNGLYVVQGEANAVLALLRKFRRSQTRQQLPLLDEHNPLLRNFADLRDVLNKVNDLSEIQFDTFISPFLEVIKSDATDGPITARALSAIEKFISYGLLSFSNIRIAGAVQSISDAVTKAKFIGTSKAGIDECVLFQILQTLRSLVLSPGGRHLSNATVCEILQCCFRIGLEQLLPELLRVAAESSLADMCRHLFAAMPTFEQDIRMGLKELMRFLIALCNPHDRTNLPQMILMGLHLLTVAFETGNEFLRENDSILPLLEDELSHTLLQLLGTQKLKIFAATNRVCFLLFETLRPHLKFQMEAYFIKLSQIISSNAHPTQLQQQKIIEQQNGGGRTTNNNNITSSYELRELALEALVDMWRLPNLVSELYLNYDCSLYCSNLFEDLVRNLLENAFPSGPLLSTHILSVDTVLTVVDFIERNCTARQQQQRSIALARSLDGLSTDEFSGKIGNELKGDFNETVASAISSHISNHPESTNQLSPPTLAELISVKKQKRLMTEGTDLFNRHSPQKGVEFLCEKGLLKNPMDPKDVVNWLRQNPKLEKCKIAEYICHRKRPEVLRAFVESFEFHGLRLDLALRQFLETFRLPGDAAEIDKIINHFSEHWHNSNNQPFEHVDAAYTLAYAILMLNTDQHNPQVRRNQTLMSVEDFKRNLSGTNHGKDFDQEMLEQIYNAIKSEEIVMPAEQVGQVRENYLWRVLMRRSHTSEGHYWQMSSVQSWNDRDLFCVLWGPLTASLHYVMNKTADDTILTKCMGGYRKCASIAAHFGMTDVFDTLIIHLCKTAISV
uniref:SEC7 domain-containing protein n=2 Tax=Meloidogyne incognita TaxID=6306 RepID=A0A914MK07_MELIC